MFLGGPFGKLGPSLPDSDLGARPAPADDRPRRALRRGRDGSPRARREPGAGRVASGPEGAGTRLPRPWSGPDQSGMRAVRAMCSGSGQRERRKATMASLSGPLMLGTPAALLLS